jgi:hypothetical protein
MIEHRADKYEAVSRYPILNGYLSHFKEVSKNNEIPGLLSFFYILGQASLPFVRIPVGGSNLCPRVSVFWIQDTRTGKSVAFEVIQKVMKDSNLEVVDYSTGTDAALVGSFVTEEQGQPPVQRPGVLAGRKGMNFDEGSILLKPNQHSEGTVLFLQSALNSAGTGRNILTKHLRDGTISIKSEVSLWITTFPPKGIKEHVLDKGIFQRVLLYWREWTLDMKRAVAHELAASVHNRTKHDIKYQEIVQFFLDLQGSLKRRVCELVGIQPMQWDNADDDTQEGWAMEVMDELFTIDDGYVPALISAIDEYYYLVENMDPHKQSVCASFIMGLQNYTNVLAHHMAMLEGTWVVRGDHIDMAKEILHDLYNNLIQWLESEVKVGMASKETKNVEQAWKMAYKRSERFDFDDTRGEGWVKKQDLFTMFGQDMNLSSNNSINTKYNQFGAKLFEETNEGRRKYVRLRKEHLKVKGDENA